MIYLICVNVLNFSFSTYFFCNWQKYFSTYRKCLYNLYSLLNLLFLTSEFIKHVKRKNCYINLYFFCDFRNIVIHKYNKKVPAHLRRNLFKSSIFYTLLFNALCTHLCLNCSNLSMFPFFIPNSFIFWPKSFKILAVLFVAIQKYS